MKGKDDEPTKSGKGRRVQFNGEDSAAANKSGGKGEAPIGGKGGKAATGGKGSASKESAKHVLNIDPEFLKNCQCLMDCEAADILQGIQEQMVFLSRDPTIKLPVSFDKGLQYAKTGARYSDPAAVRQLLEGLKSNGVSDVEICIIANICPETIDEVFALVPSLKAKKSKDGKVSDALQQALSELFKMRLSSETPNEL